MNIRCLLFTLTLAITICSCGSKNDNSKITDENTKNTKGEKEDDFQYLAEEFADIKVIRYQIPDFDKLSLQQKKLTYYLCQAGLAGRDIIWDQNYKYNLIIRKALESIITNYSGDKESDDYKNFLVYAKRVFFANGIHHHYSMKKFQPKFSREYFEDLLRNVDVELEDNILESMFNPEIDAKRVNLDPEKDLILGSANNLYADGITAAEVDKYYKQVIDGEDDEPISYGLNSRMKRDENGSLMEETYKVGGLYGEAIEKINYCLTKAAEVAENEQQKKALLLLIDYYNTGNLETWDEYNIAWVNDTLSDIDYIQGFVEVYGDAKGYRGTYESIVQVKDFDSSERMQVLSDNVQWFEDNSSIMDEHKKKNVVGVTYKVINVAGEAGDASPSTPIGVNLPNANWIRAKHGSKSVSLGNIVAAYSGASGKGMLKEFCYSEEEMAREEAYGPISDKLHTALHEVVGHASGQLNPGVGTPKETLQSYASTLEEGRADLVGLYFLMDPKLVELGLMESLDVGKTAYDGYIRNGMMLQLRRLEPGDQIEEAHMRNRQLVASWAYEKGIKDNVIEKVMKDGKTYFIVNDYDKLKAIFGQLLKEIQRIKSEGDYEAGKALVENYGVKVNPELHTEVLERSEKLNIPPYGGFINPRLVPVMEGDEIVDIKVEYPEDFVTQMLEYGKNFSFLP